MEIYSNMLSLADDLVAFSSENDAAFNTTDMDGCLLGESFQFDSDGTSSSTASITTGKRSILTTSFASDSVTPTITITSPGIASTSALSASDFDFHTPLSDSESLNSSATTTSEASPPCF